MEMDVVSLVTVVAGLLLTALTPALLVYLAVIGLHATLRKLETMRRRLLPAVSGAPSRSS
jgi:hypothetical protein